MPFERAENTKEIYKKVDSWARWARNGSSAIQGWSTTSASYRLSEQHRTGVRYEPGFISNYMDADIAAMDRVVAGLPEKLRLTLEAEFFSAAPIEVRAKKTHCSVSTFKRVLTAALLVVSARLPFAIEVSVCC